MTGINKTSINIFLRLIDKIKGKDKTVLFSNNGTLSLQIERMGAVLTPYAKGTQYAITQFCESYGKQVRIKEMRFLCVRGNELLDDELQVIPYHYFIESSPKAEESIVFDDNGMYCIFVRLQILHNLIANNWCKEIEQMRFYEKF